MLNAKALISTVVDVSVAPDGYCVLNAKALISTVVDSPSQAGCRSLNAKALISTVVDQSRVKEGDGLNAKVAETSPVGQKTVADLAQGVLAGYLRVQAGPELPPGAEVPAVAVGSGTFDGFFETMSGDELEKLRKDAIVLHGSRIRL